MRKFCKSVRICQTIPEINSSEVLVAAVKQTTTPQTGFGAGHRRRIKSGDVKCVSGVGERTRTSKRTRRVKKVPKAADVEWL